MPDEFEYLWLLFWDIVSSTDLTFSELHSYADLHRMRFTPFEVDVLRTLDRLNRMVQRGHE